LQFLVVAEVSRIEDAVAAGEKQTEMGLREFAEMSHDGRPHLLCALVKCVDGDKYFIEGSETLAQDTDELVCIWFGSLALFCNGIVKVREALRKRELFVVEELFKDASHKVVGRLIVWIVVVEVEVDKTNLFTAPAVRKTSEVVNENGRNERFTTPS
jgi:hypothetical protein